MAELKSGHRIFLVAIRASRGETRDELEKATVDWLSDVLDVSASRRSEIGEWVVGPANPVTVLPAMDQSVAEKLEGFCTNERAQRLEFIVPDLVAGADQVVVPVLVHIDWGGADIAFPDAWHDGVVGWSPAEGDGDVDLTIVASCAVPERTRDAIEPPGLLDELEEDVRERAREFGEGWSEAERLLWTGAAIAGVIALVVWMNRRKRD